MRVLCRSSDAARPFLVAQTSLIARSPQLNPSQPHPNSYAVYAAVRRRLWMQKTLRRDEQAFLHHQKDIQPCAAYFWTTPQDRLPFAPEAPPEPAGCKGPPQVRRRDRAPSANRMTTMR